MEKKKLLVTASTFPRWEGDTEPRFVLDLCKHMVDTFDVTVLVPATPGAKDREVLEGVEVIRYHYFPIHKWETLCYPGAIVPRIKEKKIRAILVPFLFLALFFKLLMILPKYDIVHAHWLIPQGIVQSFFKKPYIVTGHGGDVSSFNSGIIGKLKYRCMKKAEAVITVSKYKQEEMSKFYPAINSTIISMGVNTSFFNKEENFVNDLFQQNGKKVVLYVGRLAEIKGVNFLIEAMKYINDAMLIIVGNGPQQEYLKELAGRYKDKIKFLGEKTHEELKYIYASADILVVPSIVDNKGAQEGLPTVIMEAFASKIAVIATKTGGIPDLIENNVNGLLIKEKSEKEIAAAINRLIENKELRSKIVDSAYKTIMTHDYTRVAERYCAIMKKGIRNG